MTLSYNQQLAFMQDLKLTNGVPQRMDCPSCGGANTFTAEMSFGDLKWNCYKLNCSVYGIKEGATSISNEDLYEMLQGYSSNTHTTKKPFVEPDSFTSVEQGQYVERAIKWLKDNHCGHAYTNRLVKLRYDVREDRLVFLIRDHAGNLRGAVGRSLAGAKPKVKEYGTEKYPLIVGEGEWAILVEDTGSACAASYVDNCMGVALNGTTATYETIEALLEWGHPQGSRMSR